MAKEDSIGPTEATMRENLKMESSTVRESITSQISRRPTTASSLKALFKARVKRSGQMVVNMLAISQMERKRVKAQSLYQDLSSTPVSGKTTLSTVSVSKSTWLGTLSVRASGKKASGLDGLATLRLSLDL